MGSSMLDGWLNANIKNISVLNPLPVSGSFPQFSTPDEITSTFDIIILAVKPQILSDVCATISHCAHNKTLIISIAAGKSISSIAAHFPTTIPIVRCMPNLPASVGQGITVCIGNDKITNTNKEQTTDLLSCVGTVEWIDDEDQMHAVTALSGSGPAYLFLLTEAMTQAGIKHGLDKDLAEALARQTVIGSAHLLKLDNRSAMDLRKAVTSKGGTTQAALETLMSNDAFHTLLSDAIKAGKQRSEDLS